VVDVKQCSLLCQTNMQHFDTVNVSACQNVMYKINEKPSSQLKNETSEVQGIADSEPVHETMELTNIQEKGEPTMTNSHENGIANNLTSLLSN